MRKRECRESIRQPAGAWRVVVFHASTEPRDKTGGGQRARPNSAEYGSAARKARDREIPARSCKIKRAPRGFPDAVARSQPPPTQPPQKRPGSTTPFPNR